jgi:pectate disaccharide-lyase
MCPDSNRHRILMRSLLSACVAGLLACGQLEASTWYVATNGLDANPGTFAAPFYNVSKATALAAPGDTVFVRGGTFYYTNTVRFTNSGTALLPIRLWAYTNEHPVLDFSGMADDPNNRAFLITTNCNWWHFKGLEIYRAGDNGMKIEGSYHVVEGCVFHHCRDSGLQIGLGDSDADIADRVCSNLVLNCDSYLNYDPRASGGNADGFCCKLHPGAGNAFKGCRSWENSDDGWDLYKNNYDVTLEDCWTWHNGDTNSFGTSKAGNAEGFKLGGDSGFYGLRNVNRCIAFNNQYGGSGAGKAYHQNDHRGSITLYNCLSYSNNYNYALNNDVTANEYVKNCVAFSPVGPDHKNYSFNGTTLQASNSWNIPAITNNLQTNYVILAEAAAKAPRQADGSLPNNGFGRLVAGSVLIDRGTNVGLPFTGAAPDLGPFEYVRPPISFDASGTGLHFTGAGLNLKLDNLTGHGPVIIYTSTNLTSWSAIYTNPALTGSLIYLDATTTNQPRQFYRAAEQ